jgi:hypothetical protein
MANELQALEQGRARGGEMDGGARGAPGQDRLIQTRMRREIQRRSAGGLALPAGRIESIEQTGGAAAVMSQLGMLAYGLSNIRGGPDEPDFQEVENAVNDAISSNCQNQVVYIDHKPDRRTHWTGQVAFRMRNPVARRGSTGTGKSTTTVGSGQTGTSSHEQGTETSVHADLEAGPVKVGGEHKRTTSDKNESGSSADRKEVNEQELDKQDYEAQLVAEIQLKLDYVSFADGPHEVSLGDDGIAVVGKVLYWQSSGLHHGAG